MKLTDWLDAIQIMLMMFFFFAFVISAVVCFMHPHEEGWFTFWALFSFIAGSGNILIMYDRNE